MTIRPKFKISKLREIGWSEWNPIGLDREKYTEDEYDSYLLQAAGRLRTGASTEEVATYLVDVERDHMGLGAGNVEAVYDRARKVAEALDGYVSELRS